MAPTLLTLPLEVRLMITNHLCRPKPAKYSRVVIAIIFRPPGYRKIEIKETHESESTLISTPQSSQLLLTCRQLHNECAPIIYSANTFHFQQGRSFDMFLTKIGTRNASMVRSIMFGFQNNDGRNNIWHRAGSLLPVLQTHMSSLSSLQTIYLSLELYWMSKWTSTTMIQLLCIHNLINEFAETEFEARWKFPKEDIAENLQAKIQTEKIAVRLRRGLEVRLRKESKPEDAASQQQWLIGVTMTGVELREFLQTVNLKWLSKLHRRQTCL